MPAMRNFTVTQEREVRVMANTAEDACRIASAAFTNGQNADDGVIDGPVDVYGNTRSRVRTTSLWAREE